MIEIKRLALIAVLAVFTMISSALAADSPLYLLIEGEIVAAEDINPDRTGRPSPIVIYMYQLRTAHKFQANVFFDLVDHAEATLSADLIAMTEFGLRPGETLSFTDKLDPLTRYIAVMAAFRDIEMSQYKALVEIPEMDLNDNSELLEEKKLGVEVAVGALAISVAID